MAYKIGTVYGMPLKESQTGQSNLCPTDALSWWTKNGVKNDETMGCQSFTSLEKLALPDHYGFA